MSQISRLVSTLGAGDPAYRNYPRQYPVSTLVPSYLSLNVTVVLVQKLFDAKLQYIFVVEVRRAGEVCVVDCLWLGWVGLIGC